MRILGLGIFLRVIYGLQKNAIVCIVYVMISETLWPILVCVFKSVSKSLALKVRVALTLERGDQVTDS